MVWVYLGIEYLYNDTIESNREIVSDVIIATLSVPYHIYHHVGRQVIEVQSVHEIYMVRLLFHCVEDVFSFNFRLCRRLASMDIQLVQS